MKALAQNETLKQAFVIIGAAVLLFAVALFLVAPEPVLDYASFQYEVVEECGRTPSPFVDGYQIIPCKVGDG